MIVDCFTFYNEINLLKNRLTYMSPFVDKFVIVESTVTFRGNPKELYYQKHKDMFKEWEDKIINVIVEDNPKGENPWDREHYQRNCITRGLKDMDNETLVMISDIDEVPNVKYIQIPNNQHICSFNMVAFQYSLKYMQELEPWFGTILTTKKVLEHLTPQMLRDRRWKFPFYKNAGWHFSSFGDEKFVANKIQNFSHCFDESAQNKNEDTYKMYIEEGLHTDGKYKLVKTTQDILDQVPKEFL